MVSLYARIWGKDNEIVKRPLHSFYSEAYPKAINKLIQTFNMFDSISEIEKEKKYLSESRSALNKAGNFNHIPKITKGKYNRNVKELENVNSEIDKYKNEFKNIAVNLSELITDEALELNQRKELLLREKSKFESRIKRIDSTKGLKQKSSRKRFEKLLEYFPDVDVEKLENVESFHSGIVKILNSEIKSTEANAIENIKTLNEEISEINIKLEDLVQVEKQPKHLIEKLFQLKSIQREIKVENEYYQKKASLQEDITKVASRVSDQKEEILAQIEKKLNREINKINDIVHTSSRRAPQITLKESDYSYRIIENTGTGKAYVNLILFDLAVFSLTDLPMLVHDSYLFKQIENKAVEKIIEVYSKFDKQVFISIDEISKYNQKSQELLLKNKVIQLADNRVLYTLDWRE